jgi:hypothetical protein
MEANGGLRRATKELRLLSPIYENIDPLPKSNPFIPTRHRNKALEQSFSPKRKPLN